MAPRTRTPPAWQALARRVPGHLKVPAGPYMIGVLLTVTCIGWLVSVIGPTALIRQINLGFSVLFALVLLVYVSGCPLRTAVKTASACGLVYVVVSTLTEGHLYSSTLVWLPLIPLTIFYILGWRAGRAWMVLVGLVHLLMALLAWQWAEQLPRLHGDELAIMSLLDYFFATLVLIVVPSFFQSDLERHLREQQARRQQLQAQQLALEQTQQMQEHFIASVSHELRTPMNAILGLNSLLLERVKDRPQARKVLDYTRQSADHLMTVINDVLDYSQMHQGRIMIRPELCDLHETVRLAFDMFQPRIENTRLHYHCEVAPDVPRWVRTDRHRLMQVLVNLLGNAIKFTHEGSVRLRVSLSPAGLCFEVQDTGIGIAPDQQDKIFGWFSQADAGIQGRYGGSGLGLTISERLVRLLGGRLQLESHQGLGSRFWFLLPLHGQAPPQEPPAQKITRERQVQQNLRFLLVDDHPVNRLLVHQVLQRQWPHAQVVEAVDGAQGLRALQDGQAFDLVLMDMVMPVMDGIEATRAIRSHAQPKVRRVPVLGLTANVNSADLQRFAQAGLDSLLLKPFEVERLRAEVDRLTSRTERTEATA